MKDKIFYLDGAKITLKDREMEARGKTILADTAQNPDEQDIMQQSELKEVIQELNEDKLNREGLSKIDMLSNIKYLEKIAYHAFDSIIAMTMLPKNTSAISRIGKRLNVSLEGNGRDQIVDIVGRNRDSKKSMLEKIGFTQEKV